MKKQLTLCYLCSEEKILLGMKKRGFGVGKWNGFGGKLEEGETHEQAVVREMYEECGLHISVVASDKVAVLEFDLVEEEQRLQVHVYLVKDFKGTIVETEEMKPQWFALDDIPFVAMWKSDSLWLPLVLQGKKVEGSCSFDAEHEILSPKFTIL